MKISQIISVLEDFAPLPLQDGFDNAGIQVGDASQLATGALLCLDVTEEVIDEALELECNLIISHHPLLFKPLKSITGKNAAERCVVKACKHAIVIYAAHTNLDNAFGGVNFKIAEKIGLINVKVLSPKKDSLLKMVTFVPKANADAVRNALFNAGAGQIGNYDLCSYNVSGEGTFRAQANANPYCGKIGELHTEPEVRIETILPTFRKSSLLQALLAAHPYEEPVYDFYPLTNAWNQSGSGVVGELPSPEEESDFLQRIKQIFQLQSLKHSAFTNNKISEVAICGGSGAFLISEAIDYGADVFITGEARYNDFYDVENKILLAVIGHYESEICTKELFFDIITKKIPNFALHFSTSSSNPVKYL
jgi:dinuclear metal center YbgI/SA1388 family protein